MQRGDPVREAARALVLGLAEQARRDGGLRPSPGLTRELERLMSEVGRYPGSMESASSPPQGRWLTVDRAAGVAGTSPRTVRRLAASGRLIAVKHGWAWMVDADSAASYGKDRVCGR
jgi:hypothetical protein